jgi:hypothetical protein
LAATRLGFAWVAGAGSRPDLPPTICRTSTRLAPLPNDLTVRLWLSAERTSCMERWFWVSAERITGLEIT